METQSIPQFISDRQLAIALAHAELGSIDEARYFVASDLIARPGVTAADFAQIAVALASKGGFFAAAQPQLSLPLNAPLELLRLSNRSRNVLVHRGAVELSDLLTWSPAGLLVLPNFGVESLVDVYVALDRVGHRLGAVSGASPLSNEKVGPYRVEEKRDLASALNEIARVLVHLRSEATIADALELLPTQLRERPAADLLVEPPEASSLAARIAEWQSELNDKERLIVERRATLGPRVTMEVVGAELGMTRERVRQLEQRMSRRLASDRLVAAKIARLQMLSPICSHEQFEAAGFSFDDSTALVFMAARHSGAFSAWAEISEIDVAGEQLVLVGLATAADGLDRSIRNLMNSRPELRYGQLAELREQLIEDLSSPDQPLEALEPVRTATVVDRLLGGAELWTDEDGGYVWFGHSRAATVEARVLYEGAPVALSVLEAFNDACFPKHASEPGVSWDRRVTSLIHNNPDLIRLADDTISHTALGAEASPRLKNRMFQALDRAGGALSLNQLIRELVLEDPSTRADSVTTYALSGILFETEDGIVRRRSNPMSADPCRVRSMFKVVAGDFIGCWSWQDRCSHEAMYRSSTNIPLALVGLLGLEVGDDVVVQFPTGVVEVGFSATAVYLRSGGGFRQVLSAAGVDDGDRYRLIVTGPGQAVCERLEPIDNSSPLSVIATTVGLDAHVDPIDLVPEALGLDPYTYSDESLVELIRLRAADFANSYFTINPARDE